MTMLNKNNHIFSLPISLFAALIVGVIMTSVPVNADESATSNASVSVPLGCTMASSGNSSHNANIANNVYTPNIGTTTLKVLCNDNNGFTIYANGYTNNEDGNNVLSNTTLGTTHDIADMSTLFRTVF